jgi:hypothetical protein
MPPAMAEKRVPLKHGGEVVILGAASPAGLKGAALGGKELEAAAAAVRRRSQGAAARNRILVLLLHGTLAEARAVAAQAPELDVIILAGEPMALAAPMQAGKTLLCSPGAGGTHVGELTLRLDKRGRILSFRHFLLPLDASVPEDPALRKFLEPVTADPNKPALDGDVDDYGARVLAYIRADGPGRGGRLFLRDLAAGKDYEAPADGLLCANPVPGYGKNRIAFAGEDGAGAREIYAYEPGVDRLDTLTSLGGRAGQLRWFLRNNALLAVYSKDGRSELYRIDPWSREARNLSRGRFGDVAGFDLARAGDRLAISGTDAQGATLWAADPESESPAPIAHESGIVGPPRWNPAGDKLAWLSANSETGPDTAGAANPAPQGNWRAPDGSGELRIFDFTTRTLVNATSKSRVRSFAWSRDGKRIFYAAGVNLADINAYDLDSATQSKVTEPAASPRSEENPRPKLLDGRDGLLFEAATDSGRALLWMDLETRRERVLVDSSGYNSLR